MEVNASALTEKEPSTKLKLNNTEHTFQLSVVNQTASQDNENTHNEPPRNQSQNTQSA